MPQLGDRLDGRAAGGQAHLDGCLLDRRAGRQAVAGGRSVGRRLDARPPGAATRATSLAGQPWRPIVAVLGRRRPDSSHRPSGCAPSAMPARRAAQTVGHGAGGMPLEPEG